VAPEDLLGGIDFGDVLGGLGFDVDPGSLFERFFGRRPRAAPSRGENLEVAIQIPLDRVLHGGEEPVRVRRLDRCGPCRGSGARAGTTPRACETCKGTGQRIASRHERGILFQSVTPCPACGGRQQVIEHPCPACGGRGETEVEETLTVKIPVGIEEGMALRVPGRGLRSPTTRGAPGDLFVIVRTRPDSRFERDGADLWRVEDLEVPDAVLGTTRSVPTLDGPAMVTIAPGTQPDAVLRLRDKGLPEFGGRRRGDLYVRVRVRLPERLAAEERKQWERLRTAAGKTRHAAR
jgi:molecular chaperone DnaJ